MPGASDQAQFSYEQEMEAEFARLSRERICDECGSRVDDPEPFTQEQCGRVMYRHAACHEAVLEAIFGIPPNTRRAVLETIRGHPHGITAASLAAILDRDLSEIRDALGMLLFDRSIEQRGVLFAASAQAA